MAVMISKSKLKARMLQIFREIEESGEELIVTDNNQPVLRIQPITAKRNVNEVFREWRGRVKVLGDLDAPTIQEWGEL